MNVLKATAGILIFIGLSNPVFPQNDLSLTEIMSGEDFVGYLPKNIYWSDNSKSIYFDWNPDNELNESLYKIDLKGLSPYKVSIDELKTMPSKNGVFSKDRSRKLYEKNGDIFIHHIRTGKTDQITNTIERESNPVFTNNENRIVYRAGNNLFSVSLRNGKINQITNFVDKASGKKDKKPAEHKEWIRNDEMALFDVLQERDEKENQSEAKRDSLKPQRPVEIPLNDQYLSNLTISPDEKYVIFHLIKRAPNGNNTEVPSYVTETGYSKMLRARPNVGSPESSMKLGVIDLNKDTTYFVDPKNIPGIYDKPLFLKDYLPEDSVFNDQYKEPRNIGYQSPIFNKKGDRVVMVIRSADNKDRWIMQLDLSAGELILLDRQRDESWIGGPGIGEWNYERNTLGWLEDDITIWFQSEETGYSHLYILNTETKAKKAITSGNWEVYKVSLSNDKDYFYLTGNKEGPSERHFYRIPTVGGKLTKYTLDAGNYEVSVSPNEKMLAIRYSYSNKPWELYLVPNKPGAQMMKVTYSTNPEFNAYPWREPELVQFEAEDGSMVSARLYKPDNPVENGPAVIFVHGAGYMQNVHKWWSSYFREYMFHNLLVDQGYTVLDIDYRGSQGYGRDWRTGVYRHMGGKDLTDHVDGASYLVAEHGVDQGRIGIYGGSYGGFITIFAMFKYPEVFKCGAALRSVTDWAHYNHPYTSNRLNTPVEDSIAYRNSSPIYYAEGLEGELIMLHGMVDTNVHFQDVVRLSQKLIELGKKNWDVAIFPVENHGFKEASSWADEYRRIFELFERNLK
jgi:dipeptidyl aminopeptidase/acylaminoacyl peptidase